MKKEFQHAILTVIILSILLFTVGYGYRYIKGERIYENTYKEDQIAKEEVQINVEKKQDITDVKDEKEVFENVNKFIENGYDSDVEDVVMEHVKKGEVEWEDVREISDLDLVDIMERVEDSEYGGQIDKLVQVGEVVKGEWKGGRVLILATWRYYELWQGNLRLTKILYHDDTYHILNYTKAELDRDEKVRDLIRNSNNSIGGHERIVHDTPVIVDELVAPQIIVDSDKDVEFHRVSGNNAFFDSESVTYGFTSADGFRMGEGRSSNENAITLSQLLNRQYARKDGSDEHEFKVKNYFSTGAYYTSLPDGTALAYVMKLPMDPNEEPSRTSILEFTWNDGEKNTTLFELQPGGCGIRGYMMYGSGNDKQDYRIAGKTSKGEILYEMKHGEDESIKNMFEHGGKRKNKDLTMEEFLNMHPILFYEDAYGRLHAFNNSDIQPVAECGKPLIYLYPESEMDVRVEVDPKAGISISDPEYHNGWYVRAQEDGTLFNYADNKNYGSLFWEGNGTELMPEQEHGFMVAREELSTFFDDILYDIGLQGREILEFKEFWIPEMQKKNEPYFFVTFLHPQFIDDNAPLTITPEPDTVIRVLMYYEGRMNYETVKVQKFRTPERNGFTVVEWGGVL